MKKSIFLLVGGIVSFVLFVFAVYLFSWVTIPKGHVGVVSWFGQIEEKTLDPGWKLVNPLKTVYRVDIRTQKNEEPAITPTKGGLSVSLKAVLLYHVDPEYAPKLLTEVSITEFESRIVDPIFKNAVRDSTAEFEPEALYTSARQLVEEKVGSILRKELSKRGFVVESVMLQDPVLPDLVKTRIEQKVGAEQDVARMQFVLKQKQLEADAKVVEAQGIAKAQEIIKKDLDPLYLSYQFIEALKIMSEHKNLIYFVPVGSDGLPILKQVDHKKKD